MALDLATIANSLGIPAWLLTVLVIWSLVWKAFALWKSARKDHLAWFIALLVLNTFGILEILYLFVFSKLCMKKKVKRRKKKR